MYWVSFTKKGIKLRLRKKCEREFRSIEPFLGQTLDFGQMLAARLRKARTINYIFFPS